MVFVQLAVVAAAIRRANKRAKDQNGYIHMYLLETRTSFYSFDKYFVAHDTVLRRRRNVACCAHGEETSRQKMADVQNG